MLLPLALFLIARPDHPTGGELFTYDPGDVVESFTSAGGHFAIHYTTSGKNAVPSADADGDGVPDHVQDVAAIYEDVLTKYAGMGYRTPVDDGDGAFDVYLLDTNLSSDGAFEAEGCNGVVCSGFMVEENDFAGFGYPSIDYADRLLASHEFFHAVQAAYDDQEGSSIAEGTAVWASEQFDSSLGDVEAFSQSFLDDTKRGLTDDGFGPADPVNYGSSLFWQYVSDNYGVDVVRSVWEACAASGGTHWTDAIDDVLKNAGAPGFEDVFADFALATISIGQRADPAKGFGTDASSLGTLSLEQQALPFEKKSFAIFPASYVTFGVTPGNRTQIRVAVGDGVRVALVPITARATGDAVTGTTDAVVDVGAADTIAVQIVNAHVDTTTERPHICIGSPSEVDTCLKDVGAASNPPPPTTKPKSKPQSCANASSTSSALAVASIALACVRRRRARR